MNRHLDDLQKKDLGNDDFLWDGSGTPDSEIQHLESLLADFRHVPRPLSLPVQPNTAPAKALGSLLQMPWPSRLAAAAVLLFGFVGSIFFSLRPSKPPELVPGWDVASLEGAPQIGSKDVSSGPEGTKLRVGQTLSTNSVSRASLSETDLGEIKIDPNSRVRLLQADPLHKRLQLEIGTIHAAIWAPPGQFVVDTPSAVAVDLGCAYTLQVASDGSGTIRTTLGWVGFHLSGRDSFIPAGAMCSTRPKIGPGTPYFEDATESFRETLHQFDATEQSTSSSSTALRIILSEARPRDGLTLWHLLSRTDGRARAQVYSRFASLVPPPPGVTREGILGLDQQMLDLYWNALELGDISVWRYWEQFAQPEASSATRAISKKQSLLKQSR